ncbi:MAG TPA: hypothetical protein VGB76_22150 [Pyrinomonadaceae bacterium]
MLLPRRFQLFDRLVRQRLILYRMHGQIDALPAADRANKVTDALAQQLFAGD